MVDLDDLEVYARLDPSNMREHIRNLPEQCLRAWEQTLELEIPRKYFSVNKVVVLGVGGSAIGASLLAGLCEDKSRAPIIINRGYNLPSFVDDTTLVIASSYSGMTEETLSAFSDAIVTPAKKIVLTTGGRLKKLAEKNDIPVFNIDYKSPPRAAIANSFFPLLAIAQNIGLINDVSNDVHEAINVMKELRTMVDVDSTIGDNRAKQLALQFYDKLAIVYGAEFLSSVAQRWKTQINENSKSWSFCENLPELNHNAVVGYTNPEELHRKTFVVLLRSQSFSSKILVAYDAVSELLYTTDIGYEVVDGCGTSSLSQIMHLVQLGDWVSYYLAMLNEVDPTPVEAIDRLKKHVTSEIR